MQEFSHKGVAALVSLQQRHLLDFYNTWKTAADSYVRLPDTEDQDYNSIYTLLFHVLNSSRNYLLWICRNLEIPEPELNEVPPAAEIREKADEYILHINQKWNEQLRGIDENDFDKVFKSRWGVDFSIEAMLEHSVMHPIRHEYQLKNLLKEQNLLL